MIRDMTDDNLPIVETLERACFSSAWNLQQFTYELHENPFAYVKVIVMADDIIGYMDYWITFECCQLNKITISPEYREQGYAQVLMKELIQNANAKECETIMLEVRVSNIAAQKLYRKFNFIDVNIRKGYYSDNGEDALVMVKALGGSTI